jgi:hypothetical protein
MGESARVRPIGGTKTSIGGTKKMRTKFHYGEIYDIAPTLGLDVTRGKIQIMGICHESALPNWVDLHAWLDGFDQDELDEYMDEPWYLFEILEGMDEGEITCMPEWALEEVFHKARKEKIEKFRNRRLMEIE